MVVVGVSTGAGKRMVGRGMEKGRIPLMIAVSWEYSWEWVSRLSNGVWGSHRTSRSNSGEAGVTCTSRQAGTMRVAAVVMPRDHGSQMIFVSELTKDMRPGWAAVARRMPAYAT
jgi:hypothetical protein